MADTNDPLAQFQVKPLVSIDAFGYDVSFTNSALFMVLSVALIAFVTMFGMRKKALVPGRFQGFVETVYEFVENMVVDNAGKDSLKYMPLVFSIFLFILFGNLLGMIPKSFTFTSHIFTTFAMALIVFVSVVIIGFARHGLHFFSLFMPKGAPVGVAQFVFVLELMSFLIRPFTLAIRLAANMTAGHIVLKVIAGLAATSAVSAGLGLAILPTGLLIALTGLEFFVALLQAYIFSILTCVYLNDAVNLH